MDRIYNMGLLIGNKNVAMRIIKEKNEDLPWGGIARVMGLKWKPHSVA